MVWVVHLVYWVGIECIPPAAFSPVFARVCENRKTPLVISACWIRTYILFGTPGLM